MRSFVVVLRFAVILFSLCMVVFLGLSGFKALNYVELVSNPKDQSVDEPEPETMSDRIFFLETSGRTSLRFRQSCAAESAARQNPNHPVKVYMVAKELNYSAPSMKILRQFSNIVVESIDLDEYFSNTPLEKWYRTGTWRNSTYSVGHLSDYLRILSVWKEGGLYLDLDFVVIKPLEDMPMNCLVFMDNYHVCNGVFRFKKGHPLIGKMVEKLAREYSPKEWSAHGPLGLTHVLYTNCNVTIGLAKGPNCGQEGVNLVNTTMFFPVSYPQWKYYYLNRSSDEIPEILVKPYAIHMWNKESSNEPVFVGSSQYYALLAAKYCPVSYASALHIFKK